MCSPAIVLPYHLEDFTCAPPVSIDSGKTHQKTPAHSLVFSDISQTVFGRFSRLAVPQSTFIYLENHSVSHPVGIGTPHPLSRKRVCRGRGVPIPTTGKRLSTLSTLWAVYNPRKICKKRYLELSSIIEVYNRYLEKIIHVSSPYRIFDPGGPHDPVSTHQLLFNRLKTFFAV